MNQNKRYEQRIAYNLNQEQKFLVISALEEEREAYRTQLSKASTIGNQMIIDGTLQMIAKYENLIQYFKDKEMDD